MTVQNMLNSPEPFGISIGGTGVSSVTISPTASAWAGWDANKNMSAVNFISGYTTTVTAGASTTLTVGSNQYQYFTGSTTQTLVMPVASTLVTGQYWQVVNNSTGAITINSSGGNLILTLPAASETTVTCILNSGTTAASWTTSPAVSGSGTVNSGTQYDLAYYSATGTSVSGLATANNGVLITNGSGVPSIASQIIASNLPSGSIFNFQSATLTTPVTTTSTAFSTVTGLSVTITPTSASNSILVRAVVQVGVNLNNNQGYFQLARGSTAIGVGTSVGSRTACGGGGSNDGSAVMSTIVLEWVDSPATTSSTTYNFQFASSLNTQIVAVNASSGDSNVSTSPRTASIIMACEIHV